MPSRKSSMSVEVARVILGVGEDTSLEEVKSRYRELAKGYHPDRTSGDEEKTRQFHLIQEAFEVLSGKPVHESDAEVYEILSGCFGLVLQELINSDKNPCEIDLCSALRVGINNARSNLLQQISKLGKSLDSLKESRGRFKTRFLRGAPQEEAKCGQDGADTLEGILESHISGIERAVQEAKRQLGLIEKALKIAETVGFDPKVVQNSSNKTAYARFLISFSS